MLIYCAIGVTTAICAARVIADTHVRQFKGADPRDRDQKWRWDLFGSNSLYDGAAPISLAPSADGPIGTLARIALNARRGEDLAKGVGDLLNAPGSP